MSAHGKTLEMREIREPEPDVFVSIVRDEKGRPVAPGQAYTNPDKDRSLAGKKRAKARKAARR